MGQQLTPLDIRKLEGKDEGYWLNLCEQRYRLDSGEVLSAEPGFKTDMQSTPSPAWPLIGHPLDNGAIGGFWHDLLYRRPGTCLPPGKPPRSRRRCDAIYLEILTDKGTGWLRRTAKHQAVRMCGWWSWNRYRKAERHRTAGDIIAEKARKREAE